MPEQKRQFFKGRKRVFRLSVKTGLGVILGIFLFIMGNRMAALVAREAWKETGRYQKSENSEIDEIPREEIKTVALTFDDGPHEKWTAVLLDGLKERDVKATFFLMGENIAGKEELVKRMEKEGHLIGNHSYSHIQLTKEGMDQVCQSFEKTSDIIEGLTGKPPEYVRPPYGDWNEELECRTNLTTVLWDVDSLDWKYKNRGRIVDKVCREVRDGDIILMHDIFPASSEAALDIIDRLTKEGWQFVTVDELVVD
jgi:peptidoglycan/xylan/chitin deacetylase (PgdA/CDA1 family)